MAERKVVRLTDGTEADFPITTSLGDIDKKLSAEGLERDTKIKPFVDRVEMAQTETEKAIGKVAKPVVEGAAGIFGLPGQMKAGISSQLGNIAQLLGISPEQVESAKQYMDVGGQVKKLMGAENLPQFNMPTSQQIVGMAQEAGVPMTQAETLPGKFAQSAVRNIISAPVRSAVIPSVLSAGGEEAAAVPFEGTPLEPYARLAGGVAAPLAVAPLIARSPLEKMYAQTTKNMTPQEIQVASELQKQSFAAGVPTTSFEAMQQAAGGRTTLPAIQRQIEATPASAQTMAQFMGGRGQQTLQTLENMFPQTSRERLAGDVQKAAQGEIGARAKQLVEEAAPAFEAIKAKKIPQSWMTNLEKESAVINEAGRAVDNIPVYQDLLKGYDKNSIARVEAMRQYLSDKYDNLAVQAQGKVTGEMKAYDAARRNLLKKADDQIPAYKEARTEYQKARERIEYPLKETPIPGMAKESELPKQFGELFANKPDSINLTPAKVTQTITALGKKDPELPKEFLNQYMRASLEKINKAATRKEGTIGTRFVDTVAQNTTQKANLQTAFKDVYGQDAARGLNMMFNMLEAQGRRLPMGSPTAEKGMLAQESVSLLGKTLTNPMATLGNIYQSVVYGRDYDRLAKAITSPDGVKTLENIAKSSKDQKKLGLALTEMQQLIRATDQEAE